MHKVRDLLVIITCLALTSPSFAGDNDFKLRGFGTLGYAYSSTDNVEIVRDLSQSKGLGNSGRSSWEFDSLLGLQLDYRINDSVDSAIQLVSKNSAAYNYQPQLTWAYLSYSKSDDWRFRVGRLGYDTYMLADSRNVGFSYLWARPPIEVFGSLFMTYFDGVDLVWQSPTLPLKAKFFYGHAREKTAITDDGDIYSLNRSPMMGVYLDYHYDAWQFRASMAQIRFHDEVASLVPLHSFFDNPAIHQWVPATANYVSQLGLKDKRIRYYSLGFAYERDNFELQGMFGRFTTDTALFPDSRSAYLTLGYRLGQFKPYLSGSWVRQLKDYPVPALPRGISPELDAINQSLIESRPYNENGQSSYSIGLRIDLNDRSNLKLQIDQLSASRYLLVRKRQSDWDGRARLYSITYNFIF